MPHPRSLARHCLTGLFVAAATVPGCNRSMDELDREVADLIQRRQQATLGEEGVSDANAGRPAYPRAEPDLYQTQPQTNNPPADELPAEPAESAEVDPAAISESYELDPDAEPVELDLPGLLAYSIEHAPEYRAEKERLFLSTLSLIIERHQWGPRFFSTLSTDVAGTPESGDYDTALDIVKDFAVTQRLPYGGSVSVNALVNYTNLLHQSSTSGSAVDTQDASVGASLNLPLLRGAGEVAREDLIQAERNLVYAARDFERFRRSFFVDISNTYFSLLRQKQGIENQRLQIEGLELLAAELNAKVEAGDIAGFEAKDAEAQVLFGRSALARVQDTYASALDSLKLRIGMPVSQPLVITRADIEVPLPALDPAESIQIGQAARLDLQNTADQVVDAKRGVRIARDQLRGDLDLDATVNFNTDSDRDVGGADFELQDSDYRVGLEYGLPLDRRIEQAGYRSALVDLERADRSFRTERDRVALQVRDASREIERSMLVLELQARNVELAEDRLENITIRRRQGRLAEPRRLIEAERDLLDARNGRDEALADLQTSVLNYLLQTGQMRVDAEGRWLAPGGLVQQEAQPEETDPGTPQPDATDPDAPEENAASDE